MLPPGDSRSVPAQIDRLLKRGLQGLHFPPELEARFERESSAPRCRRLWREGLISSLAFNAFYVCEWLLTRKISSRELTLQLGCIAPLCLATNLLMRLNPPRWWREGSISVMACVIACSYLYLQVGRGEVAIAFTLVGVIVTAMFAAVVMRLRFYFALAAAVVITLAGTAFLFFEQTLALDEKMTGIALMTIAIGIAMMSNYSLEREERLGYLRFLQSEIHRQEASETNARLATLSSIDTLTSLPNRRAYEEHFDSLWEEALTNGTAFALIMIDVDHFKVMNDVRGHSYGDEVLRRVGSLLPQALRSTADLAARFGGEEFVVLLPRTLSSRTPGRCAFLLPGTSPDQDLPSAWRLACSAIYFRAVLMSLASAVVCIPGTMSSSAIVASSRVLPDDQRCCGAGDGDRTRNQRLGKPLLYH